MDNKDIIIDENITVLEAMRALDKTAKKILFLAHDNKLKASITDGDMRRWILKNGSLDATVDKVANYNPKYVNIKDDLTAKNIMQKFDIEAVPIVNDDMEIVSIKLLHYHDSNVKGDLNVPVVIMAGGLGKRLYPYTKILPKPLIPIGEIPISEYIINRFNKAGCKSFFMILNHKKNMIKAYYNDIAGDYLINYIDEDVPLGTGGGLSLLKGKIDETFILSNCDILICEDYDKIYKYHKEEKNIITIVCSLKHIIVPYGVIKMNDIGEIVEMKEKPELSFLANTGMYIAEPKVIDEIEENVSISFPEVIEKHRDRGEKIGVFPISENSWLDMGQFDSMEEMRRRLDIDD